MENKPSFEEMRRRWRESLTGGETPDLKDPDIRHRLEALEAEARRLHSSMNKSEERTCLWDDLPDPHDTYRRDWICYDSFCRLHKLVLAYAISGHGLYHDENLLHDITRALAFIHQNWYNEQTRHNGEWWHKEIGLPLRLNECMLLLRGLIPESLFQSFMRTIESFTSDPTIMIIDSEHPMRTTGANRVWKCYALAGCAVLTEDEGKLSVCAETIGEVFEYTTQKDGFYKDGSFVQHAHFAYTGGYGRSFLEILSQYATLLTGTPWSLKPHEAAMLSELIDNTFTPLIHKGGCLNMVQGREIARESQEEHIAGHQIIGALLLLSDSLPTDRRDELLRRIKYWIQSDRYRSFYDDVPLALICKAKNLLRNERIDPLAPPDECRIYAGMDRVVHRRKHYTLGIAMNSVRIGRYESIHDESVRGWYTGDGTVYLYNDDLSQYSDGFFPTVNAYRMPGTTVDTMYRAEKGFEPHEEPEVRHTWAGGCQLNHRYGAVGMDIEVNQSDLSGKKSWFLFDDEIICLGAAITCTSGRKIETIVDNRKVASTFPGGTAAEKSALFRRDCGKHGTLVTIHGKAAHSDVSYYLPASCAIETLDEDRTDRWQSIQNPSSLEGSESTALITNRYETIVIPHGINPKNADYQYFIIPGKKSEELQDYASTPPVEILENTDQAQAVHHTRLGLTTVNFWQDQTYSVGEITCSGKASVIMEKDDRHLTIAVADPTWQSDRPLLIEINASVRELTESDEHITVLRLHPTLKIQVDLQGGMGQSCQASFAIH